MEFASKIVCVTLLNQEDSFNEVMTKDLQESITVEITGFEGKVNSESKVWNEIRKINNCRISNDITLLGNIYLALFRMCLFGAAKGPLL